MSLFSANELDMEILCFKVMTNVVTLVGADRGSLFLTRKEGGQKLLVSKLFGKRECLMSFHQLEGKKYQVY